MNQANKDFDALVGRGGNVTNRGGGLRTATLKDGHEDQRAAFQFGRQVDSRNSAAHWESNQDTL